MTTRLFSILLTVALAGCATTASTTAQTEDPELTKALAGKTAGAPVTCLSLSDARSSETLRGAIVYRVNRNLTYVNTLNSCPILNRDRIPVNRVYGSQLCRGDIVNFIDRGSGSSFGSCTMGDFVPYRTTVTK